MKGYKRIVVMAFALSLALAVDGYADELSAGVNSEEEIPVWSRSDAKPEATASIGSLAGVNSEEEIPVWSRSDAKPEATTSIGSLAGVNSEEEIPVWNREEVSSWHPGRISQISR